MSTPASPGSAFAGADDVVVTVMRLQAQGYPIDWQEERVGWPLADLIDGAPTLLVEGVILDRLAHLVRCVGETMARPSHGGLTQSRIDEARADAAAAGYYPPAAYDDDGRLVPGAVEGHPWARADAISDRRLTMMGLALEGLSNAEIADRVDVTRRTVDRVTKVMKRELADTRTGSLWRSNAEHALRMHRHDEENSTVLALKLGLINGNDVRRDHPAHARMRALPDDLGDLTDALAAA